MKTALAIALVALFLAVVEVKGQQEKVVEVEEEEKGGKISQHDWDYYGEEVASDKKRKRRQTFEEKRELDHLSKSPGDAEEGSRLKRNPKKSAIRINQEMTEIKNNTEPLLVEDPPGIGLGHILGITTTLLTNINYKIDFQLVKSWMLEW